MAGAEFQGNAGNNALPRLWRPLGARVQGGSSHTTSMIDSTNRVQLMIRARSKQHTALSVDTVDSVNPQGRSQSGIPFVPFVSLARLQGRVVRP